MLARDASSGRRNERRPRTGPPPPRGGSDAPSAAPNLRAVRTCIWGSGFEPCGGSFVPQQEPSCFALTEHKCRVPPRHWLQKLGRMVKVFLELTLAYFAKT